MILSALVCLHPYQIKKWTQPRFPPGGLSYSTKAKPTYKSSDQQLIKKKQ